MPGRQDPHAPRRPVRKPEAPSEVAPNAPEPTPRPPMDEGQLGPEEPPLAVVALGASAGGLEAFQLFLDALPAHTGLAFVMVQHLARETDSLLPELLARHTSMPVHSIEDRMPLAADHLYVMPPGAMLGVHAGTFQLEPTPARVSVPLPIDHFFTSLAAELGPRAIAIILSGTGRDGTQGLQAIKEHGGVVLAQDLATAEQNGMPASAIRTGLVDEVLPVQQMPELVLRYARATAAGAERPVSAPESALATILTLLRARTGYDFRGYKQGTLLRRIQRRMGLRGLSSTADYLVVLQAEPDELQTMAKDLMIGVTRFFRDPEAYAFLGEQVLPPLIAATPPGTTLRIWSVGCASGEEPYSLAMMLAEALAQAPGDLDYKIMASDIDREALDVARRGFYPRDIEADVSAERLERFFTRSDAGYQISRQLRERIVFAEQNLVADAPFSQLDLIVCRNLLIYLEPSVQENVIDLFHYVLKEQGYLWLGSSESTCGHPDRFIPLSKKWRVFQRSGPRSKIMPNYPITAIEHMAAPGKPRLSATKPAISLEERVRKLLLDRFIPAAVLIGDQFEVLYLHGPTGDYLAPPAGLAPFNLLAMCPQGLRHQVRATVLRARREQRRAEALGGQVERQGVPQTVRVTAEQVDLQDMPDATLVFFEDHHPALEALPAVELDASDQHQVARLELELRATKEDLNDTIEALESSNRELTLASQESGSLNEELQSANEELQSTNEELETSREELQSLNEELTSVNNQLTEKLQELEGTNNDLINLLASTDIATIFLDLTLRIRRYTPAIRELLNLQPSDHGRPIGDLARKFRDDQLLDDAQHVLDTLQPREAEVMSEADRWYLRRVIPYRTTTNRIDGVVITFTEISRLKAAETALRAAHAQLQERNIVVEGEVADRTAALGTAKQNLQARSEELATQKELFEIIVDHAPVGIAYYDRDLTVRWANPTLAKLLERPLEHLIQRKVGEAFVNFNEPLLRQLEQVMERGVPIKERNVPISTVTREAVNTVYMDMMYVPVHDLEGQVIGVVGMLVDVSERVEQERMQQAQIDKLREVDRLKTDFLNAASHELRTPLSSVTGYAEFLEDRIGGPLTEEQDHYVAEIQKGGRRLQHLVDDLLDFARLEAGTFALASQETDLARLLATEITSLRPQAEEGQLTLALHVPDEPQLLLMDAQRIGQVILNVVGNALKFTPRGGHVDVTLTHAPDHVVVEVKDDGPGIASEHLPHLFERFFQVDPSLTRAHGGTGLGLAISKPIVEAHGGEIGVRSTPGVGSTFWFTLPLRPDHPAS